MSSSAPHRTWFSAIASTPILTLLASLAFSLPLPAQTLRPNPASPVRSGGFTGQTSNSVLDGSAIRLQRYDSTRKLRLAIALNPPHMAEEKQLLADLQNKQSPLFHKYLTPDQWRERFAPSADDEQAVVDWITSEGLTVTKRYPNRLLVDVEGPVATIETALGVTINSYQLPDSDASDSLSVRFSNDREPVLPSRLTGIVQSFQGLNSFETVHAHGGTGRLVAQPDYVAGPVLADAGSSQKNASSAANLQVHSNVTESSPFSADNQALPADTQAQPANVSAPAAGYFTPKDMWAQSAYDYNALMRQGHCCNPTNYPSNSPPEASIAIAAFGEIDWNDVNSFQSYFNYLATNAQGYNVDGGYTCNNANGEDNNCTEVSLDVEWSLAMANSQGASSATSKIFVYMGSGSGASVIDVYNAILNDGFAKVMSTSWGCAESYQCSNSTMQSRDNVLSEMAGEGWTLVAASGDEGATATCSNVLSIQYPASDPNVIGVGGTQLAFGAGNGYEVAWTGDASSSTSCGTNNGGGTGGFSEYFGVPGFQSGMGFSNRAVPDIALDAFYGHDTFVGGGWAYLGGTSVGAPMVAGFFAQENAYMLAIGNKCGSSGTSPCAPIGNADYAIYQEGIRHNGGRVPFYDIVQGCNSNWWTNTYNLGSYCAATGYDEATGWGSANMLQLAWAINWEDTTANGIPYVSFSGPATNHWYNTNQTVDWSVIDFTGDSAASTGTGIAGFTQGWDSIPADPASESFGSFNSGDSFYTGPEFVNGSGGCLSLAAGGCGGGVLQGCHTVHVEGWNNQGMSTGDSAYGPLCYDTVAPYVYSSTSPAYPSSGWFKSSVQLVLSPTDSGGLAASGIAHTYYGIGANTSCSPSNTQACSVYSSPLTISTTGTTIVTYFTEDNAGNFSYVTFEYIRIDETAPTVGASFSGTLVSGVYQSAVTVQLTGTDTLSGVASIWYSLNGGSFVQYSGAFPVTTLGTNSVKYYAIDSAGNQSTTQTSSFTIHSPTTTRLTTSANPIGAGKSLTLTAVVAGSVSGTPAGTVAFKNGSITLGTVTLTNGTATYTTSSLPAGNDSLLAVYGGAANDLASTSNTITEDVQAATTTTVASSLNPGTYGASIALKATVKPTSGATVPTGTVQFKDGSTVLGSASLSAGAATITTKTLPVGSDNITVVYAGAVGFAASTSASLVETVKAEPTTTTLSATTTTPTYGESVTFTATIAGTNSVTPTGSVTFKNGSTTLGTVALSSGVAKLTTTSLPVGSETITADYVATTDYAASASAATTVKVGGEATTTTLATTLTASTYGQSVTFTATVKGTNSATPAGNVTFKNGSTTIGTVALSSGIAKLTIATLPVGSDSIAASYIATTDYAASTSAATTVKVSVEPTTTALSTTTTSAIYGGSVTFTATVKGANSITPTGYVAFKNGSTTLGSVILSSGTAKLTTSALPGGSDSITAAYLVNTDYAASTSTVVTVKVSADATSTALTTSTTTATYGEPVTLTATVKVGSSIISTGSVTFKSGSTTLGTVALSSGIAKLTTTTLPVGSDSVTAAYIATSDYAASTSAAATVKVSAEATSAVLTTSTTTATYGESVTFTAIMKGANSITPTGYVAFKSGSTTLGSVLLSSGTAKLTTTTLQVGSDSITAAYLVNTDYAASTSAATTVKVNTAATTTTLIASPDPATKGSTVTLKATVKSSGGTPTGTVTFKYGSTSLGNATLSGSVATLSTTTLPAGSDSLTAVYAGSTDYAASTSSAVVETIN
jgi:Pro-kumamolisin, activation domain/Bacterial Ig-like domain (group 3)